jgi:hypothetical protein
LTFEQNRGQAPNEVKWLGHGSSYRILFDGDGATFLLPAKNDTRVIAGRRPLPVDRSFKGRRWCRVGSGYSFDTNFRAQ